MFFNEKIEFYFVKDHFIGSKKNLTRNNFEQNCNIFKGPDMISDYDIGAIFDKIFPSLNHNSFSKKGKIAESQDNRLYSLEFSLKLIHLFSFSSSVLSLLF